jgi:hypothetical protein
MPPRPDLPPPRSRLVLGFFVAFAVLIASFVGYVVVSEVRDHGEYRFLKRSAGAPVTWDPCTQIRYVVNDALAPAGAEEDLAEAVRRLEAATGLDLVDAGHTDWTLREYARARGVTTGLDGEAVWAPVLISWEDASSFRQAPDAYGVANVFPGTGTWRDRFVTGFVVMNADQELPTGFDSDGAWGPVFMHELAHLVGLNHVSRLDEVMAPGHVPPWPTDWGEGDRRGLALLGRTPCRDGAVPPPVGVPGEPLTPPVPAA